MHSKCKKHVSKRCASVESELCVCQVQDRYLEDGNDKLKLMVLLCGEDDEKLQIAAAGALAMLTGAQKKLCLKMTLVVCTTAFSSAFTVQRA